MSSPAPASKDAIVARMPGLHMVEVDGETVVMSADEGVYYGLAETAQAIWGGLSERTTAGEICAKLVAAYDGEPSRIEADVLAFLGTMAEARLITVE